jgi:hypothetical protein
MGWQNIFAAILTAGNTTVINSAGIFVYAGVPANGNLIVSIATSSGTDPYGNPYQEGLTVTQGTITGVTITGSTIKGPDFIFNSSGLFVYNGTPATGNLILSLTAASGTDGFGNPYDALLSVYGDGNSTAGPVMNFSVTGTVTQQNYITNAASEEEPAAFFAQINNKGAANESMSLYFVGPASTFDNNRAAMIFNSATKNGNALANAQLQVLDGNTVSATVGTWDVFGLYMNLPIIMSQPGSTPAATSGAATIFSANSDLQVVDGADLEAYGTQRRTIVTGSNQTISSTTFASVASSSLAAPAGTSRQYHITGRMNINPSQAAGGFAIQLVCPNASSIAYDIVWQDAHNGTPTAIAPVAFIGETSLSTSLNPGFTMTTGHTYYADIDCTLTMPAGDTGAFGVQFATPNSGDSYVVLAGSWIEVFPV